MIETQTEKPTVTIAVPSWIMSIGKIVDYAASAVLRSSKAAIGGNSGVEQSDGRENMNTGGASEGQSSENATPPSKKFKFQFNKFNKLNFNFARKLKMEKIKGIGVPLRIRKHPKIVLIALAIVLVLGFAAFKIAEPNKAAGNGINGIVSSENSSTKVNINRKFEVPIKNKDGSETGEKLGITITDIEKTNEILIKNSPAKTKNGKIFLVINMEIQNDTKKQLTVKPVDMVRLIGDDGRSYAPDVHNNEVSAEPVSLRKTRVGYVVDRSKNSFKLFVGEVRGQQEPIEVSF